MKKVKVPAGGRLFDAPGLVWRRREFEFERAAGDEFLVVEPTAGERLAIKHRGANVTRARAVAARGDGEGARVPLRVAAVDRVDAQRHLIEERREKFVARVAGAGLVDTARGEDVPGGHLAHILVAAEAVGAFAVGFFADVAHPLLRQPR